MGLNTRSQHPRIHPWAACRNGAVDFERLRELVGAVGKDRLVLDLSCRKRRRQPEAAAVEGDGAAFEYVVVTDRWQKWTDVVVNEESLTQLAGYCAEFLVHGVDVEGLRAGIEDPLVELLGRASPIPVTYAGGVRDLGDRERVRVRASLRRSRACSTMARAPANLPLREGASLAHPPTRRTPRTIPAQRLGGGRVDVTIGSALDIFGGSLPYAAVVAACAPAPQQAS